MLVNIYLRTLLCGVIEPSKSEQDSDRSILTDIAVIVQLVRAWDSQPKGRGFESPGFAMMSGGD